MVQIPTFDPWLSIQIFSIPFLSSTFLKVKKFRKRESQRERKRIWERIFILFQNVIDRNNWYKLTELISPSWNIFLLFWFPSQLYFSLFSFDFFLSLFLFTHIIFFIKWASWEAWKREKEMNLDRHFKITDIWYEWRMQCVCKKTLEENFFIFSFSPISSSSLSPSLSETRFSVRSSLYVNKCFWRKMREGGEREGERRNQWIYIEADLVKHLMIFFPPFRIRKNIVFASYKHKVSKV